MLRRSKLNKYIVHISFIIHRINFIRTIMETKVPLRFHFGVLDGLCKTHKKVLDQCLSFRPILSAIKTSSYNSTKFLVPLIDSITNNNFTVKNSFEFSKEICEQNPKYSMASLDVESLFANIPLEETIKIRCDSLHKNQELLSNCCT